METYLEGKEPSEEELIKCIRKGTLNLTLFQYLLGQHLNKGVQPLLDAVIDYLPSPKDIGSIEATKLNSEEKLQMKFEDSEPFLL